MPVLDTYMQVPQGASVERVVPDRYGVSHDISMSLGDFDEDRREQILTLEYVSGGSSLREVARCPVGQPELRYVGGRRPSCVSSRCPIPPATPAD